MSELRDAIAQAIRTAGDPDADGRAAADAVLALIEQGDVYQVALKEGEAQGYARALDAQPKPFPPSAVRELIESNVRAERERIRQCIADFPLNICGYGAPMPADHAASVEQFREALLETLRG